MLVIFDWDGTLADSTGKIVRCLAQASEKVGLPILANDEYANIIGLGLPEAILALYPKVDQPLRTSMQKAYSEYFIGDKEATVFFKGVNNGLRALKQRGFKLAVATGKSRRGLQRVLNEKSLLDFFDATRCADETQSKPSPLMLNEILAELGFKADDAIMVGDTSFDLEMASNAGMRSLAVDYGAHSIEMLRVCKPVGVVSDFDECVDAITKAFNTKILELAKT